jgi:DnaD/phage-associated family protein
LYPKLTNLKPKNTEERMIEAKFNIYKAYTDNIGNITPMIADELKLDEDEYGAEMVIEAIKVAAFSNARNIKYIEAVLRNTKNGSAARKYAERKHELSESDMRARMREWEAK